jgi:ABC-type antimicrobial peptide transport system permease subunit
VTPIRFIVASLRHYRRIHVAVALGVAVATAVLTGALLVGDSVRGSLLDLTLERLGRTDSALVAGTMFREALADEIVSSAEFKQHFTNAEPAILITGTLQSGRGESTRRATSISVIGCRESFWSLQLPPPGATWVAPAVAPWKASLEGNEIAITEAIADELKVKAGDSVLLRIPTPRAIPADSPLGEKNETSLSRSFTVKVVAPASSFARFGLAPSQHLPRNAFVPLAALQDLLEQPVKANVILVATENPNVASDDVARLALQQALKPRLDDYGLRVEGIESPTECVQISADQLVLSDAVVRAAEEAIADRQMQPVITYLANTIAAGSGESQRKIPYSTITGVDSTAALGPLVDEAGEPIVLSDSEIALNRWAADDLKAKVGDTITVTFYEPESTHGRLRERDPPPQFKLAAIVELETADGQPTRAADPKLTPELPGVTDQASIDDWELPFELVEKIRPQDEEYWGEYRTTPKAFVSLATAKRLWPSRWGTISLLRLPVGESLRSKIRRGEDSHGKIPYISEGEVESSASTQNAAGASHPRLGETRPHADGEAASAAGKTSDKLLKELDPAALGLSFLPVKELGLAAATGTTPFDWLFLGFSFFLMASAIMLIAILFQLGVEQRTRELGALAAVGVGRKRIATLLSCEGLLVAAIGAAIGVVLGIGYAGLMMLGLRTWWVAAISTPFLELHVTRTSLLLGWLIGVAISWLTILWSIRRLVRQSVVRLLAGSATEVRRQGRRGRIARWPVLRIALALVVLILIAVGFMLHDETQAGVFFGVGALVLILLLGEARHQLRKASTAMAPRRRFSFASLTALNTARNPTRSSLTIGLVAAASFLIVALSAFRLDTSSRGTGGFHYIATSDLPIHYDLNTAEGRVDLGLSDEASKALDDWRIYSLRLHAGEDASCLNLYRPTQPRVLGLPDSFIEHGGFEWSAIAKTGGDNERQAEINDNPWRILQTSLPADEDHGRVIPVVLDANTATYSLHLGGVGARFTIRDAADQPVTLQVVGLLKNSVLQGNVLVSESNFLRMFPDTGGYRFFFLESRNPKEPLAAGQLDSTPLDFLEDALGNEGLHVISAQRQLAQFMAVQNTYLSTFQSLGALGLLLGTVGLAVVQLRSVLERRAELALMRAGGFSRARLVRMVVGENAVLLLGGLMIGCVAAAVALIPQIVPLQVSIPWRTLAAMLGTIAVIGLGAGWLATRGALRAPILPALRGD